MHTLNFTVEVKSQEDPETVRNYFTALQRIFERITNLSEFGFDTPVCSVQTYYDSV